MANVTFNRVANGEFTVLNNGIATEYRILNGCLGMSGNGANVYIITKNGEKKQTGLTLAKAKKVVMHTIKREADELHGWVPEADPDAWKTRDAALIAAHCAA